MSRAAFPMSKVGGKGYRLGNRKWRVLAFRALGLDCRLLITVSANLCQYQAWLGVIEDGDTKIVSQLERHAGIGHSGWHIHAACDGLEGVPPGIVRGPWLRRLKRGEAYLAKHPFDFSDFDAYNHAYRFYRLGNVMGGSLL